METPIILKYLAWAVANGLALAGAWFVNFTVDDGHRKKLTLWGKLALPLALASFALALGLTIQDDLANEKKARDRSVQEADWDLKLSEIVTVLRQKQDKQFQVTNQILMTMNLPPEVLAEINALNERRAVLQYQWDELQRQLAEATRTGTPTALERQKLGIRMSEVTQEIESVLNRLAGYEVRSPSGPKIQLPEQDNRTPPIGSPSPPNGNTSPPSDNRIPANGNQAPSAPTGLRVEPS